MSATPKTTLLAGGGEVVMEDDIVSTHDMVEDEIEEATKDLRAQLAAKERECEELKQKRSESSQGGWLIAYHKAIARGKAAEARCEALEAACRRQVENIERWIQSGEPAGPEESKAIYEQLKAALRAVEGWDYV